jgi:ATP-dependent Clp protease protease subunit
MKKILNFKWGTIAINIGAEETDAAEMMVYDTIGKDPWSEGGISASDFKQALDEITPKTRPLNIRVNSRGGDVHEGMAMMSLLNEWGGDITTTIDGVAASTASWAFIGPADKVVAGRGTQVFIHDAMAFTFGNEEELIKTAKELAKTSDQIAEMYAEKSSQSPDKDKRRDKDQMRSMMRDETLLTAEEAQNVGLVDEIVDKQTVRNFTAKEIAQMHNSLARTYNHAAKLTPAAQPTTQMNKKKIISLLNVAGVTQWNGAAITEQTSDEDLAAALEKTINEKKAAIPVPAVVTPQNADDIAALKQQIDSLVAANNESRKQRITNEVQKLVDNDQLPANSRDKAVARAMADESYLDELRALPAIQPGAPPVNGIVPIGAEPDFKNLQTHLLDRGNFIYKNFGGKNAPERVGPEGARAIHENAMARAQLIKKHKNMLVQMWNTNTIDAGLQRQVIMSDIVEEFALRIMPVQAFSMVFSSVPLEGTDKIEVPFFPLQTAASNSWVAANGYATASMSNTTQNTREVYIGGGGSNSGTSAAAGTCADRKWLGMSIQSYELARQPYQNWAKLYSQNGNKLAVDVFGDLISRVIQPVNFGNPIKSVPAAAFGADDVADLYSTATGQNWPEANRYLTFNHPYNAALLKDPTFKYALNYGSTDPIRAAKIQEAYGFENIYSVPNLNSYFTAANQQGNPAATNQYVQGWINNKSAVIFAASPIMPTPEVRALIASYDMVPHPVLGVALEFRRFGDLILDSSRWTVECSYGGAKGVASALNLISSQ